MAATMAKLEELTAEETIKDVLKRHLARDLYGAELKLVAKLRTAGKPCDCLDSNRNLGLEATAQKLTSVDPNNRVYHEIVGWIQRNRPYCRFSPSGLGSMTRSTPRWPANSQTSASVLWVRRPLLP